MTTLLQHQVEHQVDLKWVSNYKHQTHFAIFFRDQKIAGVPAAKM